MPDAVLVGESAAALWASHRTSFDHDHVLADLSERFDAVLDARTIRQLGRYKGLDARWTGWDSVTGVGRALAAEMTR